MFTIAVAIFCFFVVSKQVLAQTEAEAKDSGTLAVVLSRNIQPYQNAFQGFIEVLNNKGYKFGVTTNYDLKGDVNQASAIAQEIKRQKPDLILTVGTEATKAMSTYITDIPIVFSMALISNLSDSEKAQTNLTGASMSVSLAAQLKELNAILPQARKIGIICSSGYYSAHFSEREKAATASMGVQLIVKFAKNETEFTDAVKVILPDIDVFLFVPDETILSPRTTQFILLETFRTNKPVIAPSLRLVQDGALFALASDYTDIGRQSAELAIQILQGNKVADLPVTEARTTHLYLSLRTAKQMGIPIPQGIISRADKIFE